MPPPFYREPREEEGSLISEFLLAVSCFEGDRTDLRRVDTQIVQLAAAQAVQFGYGRAKDAAARNAVCKVRAQLAEFCPKANFDVANFIYKGHFGSFLSLYARALVALFASFEIEDKRLLRLHNPVRVQCRYAAYA